MSLDLERIYEGMAEEADRADMASLEWIRRRSRRRSLHIAASTVAAFAVVSIIAVVTVSAIAVVPLQRQVGSLGRFLPFDSNDQPVMKFRAGSGETRSVTRGDVTYLAWNDMPGGMTFAAYNLKERMVLWGPVKVGEIDQISDMRIARDAILTMRSDFTHNRYAAIDPATGRLLWQREVRVIQYDHPVRRDESIDYLLYDDVAIIGGIGDPRKVEAVELRTGRAIWSTDWTPHQQGLTAARAFTDFLGYSGGGWSLPIPTDRRFTMRTPNNKIQLRAVDTGAVLNEFSGPSTGGTSNDAVIDGKLYIGDAAGITQFDLDRPGEPRRIYHSGVSMIAVCSPGLICVYSQAGLVAIDPISAQVRWHDPLADTSAAISAGRHAVVSHRRDSVWVVLDPDGKQLLELRKFVYWIDDEHVMTFEFGPGEVSVYKVATGERIKLGVAEWQDLGCSWNATMLACPTFEGLKIWRYRS